MSVGRPRGFDTDQALDKAVELFWIHGYEGTSLADLTEAMGINKPSLYAAFGNKEALFRKAVRRYVEEQMRYIGVAMEQPTARAAMEELFDCHARFLSDQQQPPGCMTVQSAFGSGEDGERVQRELVDIRHQNEVILQQRLERGIADGDLRGDTDVKALARYLSTIAQGMSLKATEGLSYGELASIGMIAMRAWPE